MSGSTDRFNEEVKRRTKEVMDRYLPWWMSADENDYRYRRSLAYHEAGHAVIAYLLGDRDIEIVVEDKRGCVTRGGLCIEAAIDGSCGPAALAQIIHCELLIKAAGPVAEKIAIGYLLPSGEERDLRWFAVREARLEAGLPICAHWQCRRMPLRRGHAHNVIERANFEVAAQLKDNWPFVERVANALCSHDRLIMEDLDRLAHPEAGGTLPKWGSVAACQAAYDAHMACQRSAT